MDTCDVAIVGAGPAGAAAARECVRHGLATVVIEKRTLPRHKACSGILIPRSRAMVEEHFGPMPRSVIADPPVIRVMRMHFPSGRSINLPIDGTGIWRSTFDAWLCERAGGEMRESTTCVSAREVADSVVLALRTAQDKHVPLQCRVLIVANGGTSSLVRDLDPTFYDGAPSYFNMQEVYPCTSRLEAGVFHYFAMPAISPYPSAYVKDGVLVMEVAVRAGDSPGAALSRFHDYLWPRIGVAGAESVRRVGCWVTMTAPRGRFYFGTERILVAGEASGLLNLFGEGISSALASGIRAGRAAVKSVREDRPPGPTYRRAVQPERRRTEAQYRYGRLISRTSGVFDWRAALRDRPLPERVLLVADLVLWFLRLHKATR